MGQRFTPDDDIDTILALRAYSLSICYFSYLNHLMRLGTHKRPSVRVDRFIGPQNRGANGRNAGQRSEERSFSLEIPNAVHFSSFDEERTWRHRHRIHVDRRVDFSRRDRLPGIGRRQGDEHDEQRRERAFEAKAGSHDFSAAVLTKVTRCMVVPVGQADRVDHHMLSRLPFVFYRLV